VAEQTTMKTQAKQTNEKMAVYLIEQRKNANYTMRALADELGIAHSFIGKIEQQNRRMDVGEFIFYCQTLKKDPAVALQEIMAL
jgi:transcriptional regulator with XRE-family HTH domain